MLHMYLLFRNFEKNLIQVVHSFTFQSVIRKKGNVRSSGHDLSLEAGGQVSVMFLCFMLAGFRNPVHLLDKT